MSYNVYNLIIANTKDSILLNQIFKELKKQYTDKACNFQMKNDAIYFTGEIRSCSIDVPDSNPSYLDIDNYSHLTSTLFKNLYGQAYEILTHHPITLLESIEEYVDGQYFEYMTYNLRTKEWESSLTPINI